MSSRRPIFFLVNCEMVKLLGSGETHPVIALSCTKQDSRAIRISLNHSAKISPSNKTSRFSTWLPMRPQLPLNSVWSESGDSAPITSGGTP
jgi:hypothetical protein